MSKSAKTPMMEQYYDIKKKHPGFILFFRLGDFYEMFDEDAEIASKILNITLTHRGEQKMCGIPHHASNNYLFRLIKAGKKVAICDQVEEPGKGKLVRREITELITPGTFMNEKYLLRNKDSFLVALEVRDKKIAFAVTDSSTGKFWILHEDRNPDKIASVLNLLNPSEIILSRYPEDLEGIIKKYYTTLIPDYYFSPPMNEVLILEHFKVGSLKGLSLTDPLLVAVAGAALRYLRDNLFKEIKHIHEVRFIRPDSYVYLPESTLRNLEVLEPLYTNQQDTSLYYCLNQTQTSMGARELRNYLTYPLLELEAIEQRLNQVEALKNDTLLLKESRAILAEIPDLERMFSRIALGKTHPKEVAAFKEGFILVEKLKKLSGLPFEEIKTIPCTEDIIKRIEQTIENDPPVDFEEGGVIRDGFNVELDHYKKLTRQGKEYLLEIEQREKEATGIPSLKLRYNKVVGYYIEITKSNLKSVPSHYIRKQSMVGGERYTIEELIEYESKIFSAKSQMVMMEKQFFKELIESLLTEVDTIKKNIDLVKKIDISSCFAHLAAERKYVRPQINEDLEISIEDGRHPVVELFTEKFIPNSIDLNDQANRLLIITGPNMAGKSTFLRQAALITLMAHIGCFVPAKKAKIGLTDQIFTRVGASDNLAGGESTFLVEMSETSQILRNASPRSLIIMDEVGRGTSTHDGLSLAWAIVEYLIHPDFNRGKVLFATHYHELTVLGEEKGVQNYRVAVKEWNNEIIFMHKVEKGSADKSYGIHVAEIAGIPKLIIERAREILSSMEISLISNEKKLLKPDSKVQDSLFSVTEDPFDKIKSKLLAVDVNHTTPIQALLILEEIQREMRKKQK